MKQDEPDNPNRPLLGPGEPFFQMSGHWYFRTREGEIGPFRTREDAGREALAYVAARRAGACADGLAGADALTDADALTSVDALGYGVR